MANRYFNKQVAESRKPLNIGGPAGEMISIPVSEKKGRNTFKASIKKVVKGGKEHQNYMEKEKRAESRKPLAVGGILVKLGKAGTKYLKNNPDKVKKIMESPLPKKTKDLSKKFIEMFKDRKVKK